MKIIDITVFNGNTLLSASLQAQFWMKKAFRKKTITKTFGKEVIKTASGTFFFK